MFRRLLSRAAGGVTAGVRALPRHLPSQCAVCRAWPAEPLCNGCVTRFAQPVPRCRTCAIALPAQPPPPADGTLQCGGCLSEPPPLDLCLAAVSYGYPWAGVLTQFKFQGQPGWAGSLATLLRSTPWVEPALDHADAVVALPLSPRRLRERGFNQSLLLARALAPGKTDAHLLLRLTDTPPQHALPRSERLRNLRGAFAVDPLRASEVAGKRLVLVDDVMTTGASLFTAAAALKAAGAAHVTGLVLARTEAPAG